MFTCIVACCSKTPHLIYKCELAYWTSELSPSYAGFSLLLLLLFILIHSSLLRLSFFRKIRTVVSVCTGPVWNRPRSKVSDHSFFCLFLSCDYLFMTLFCLFICIVFTIKWHGHFYRCCFCLLSVFIHSCNLIYLNKLATSLSKPTWAVSTTFV